MAETARFDDHMPEDHIPDRSKMRVTDEVAIQITGMNKWYGEFHVLRDIDLTVYRGSASSSAGRPGPASRPLSAASTGWRSTRSAASPSMGSS